MEAIETPIPRQGRIAAIGGRIESFYRKKKATSRIFSLIVFVIVAAACNTIPPINEWPWRWILTAKVSISIALLVLFFLERNLAKQKQYNGFWLPWILILVFWSHSVYNGLSQQGAVSKLSSSSVAQPISTSPVIRAQIAADSTDYNSLWKQNRTDLRRSAQIGLDAFNRHNYQQCEKFLKNAYFLEEQPGVKHGEEYAITCPLMEASVLLQNPDKEHYKKFHEQIDELVTDIGAAVQQPDAGNWLKIRLNDAIIRNLTFVRDALPADEEKQYLDGSIDKVINYASHKVR
jgi:low affinity Fe/Cu permease